MLDPHSFRLSTSGLGRMNNGLSRLFKQPGETQALGPADQVIYIISETRSGSTWLSYVLGTHPKAAHLGEYFRPFQRQLGRTHSPVACRLCEARGLEACELLHGIEQVPVANAYGFALERFRAQGVTTLIDASKELDWLKQLRRSGGGANRKALAIKVVHLVRDPRGWLASERRRNPMTMASGLKRWQNHFRRSQDFLNHEGLPQQCITYDQLCLQPEASLKMLSEFVGLNYDTSHLQYWNCQHHGLGGNGAALNNLAGAPLANPLTGDDRFYTKHFQQVFYDLRWRQQSDVQELDRLSQDPLAAEILHCCGMSFEKIDRLSEAVIRSEAGSNAET